MKKSITFLLLLLTLSCEEIINEQNISNDTVNLLAPTENVQLKTTQKITFTWAGLSGATQYHLQIATPAFTNAVQIPLDTLVTRTDFAIDSLPSNNYQWRIKAVNSAFETTYTTHNFSVEN